MIVIVIMVISRNELPWSCNRPNPNKPTTNTAYNNNNNNNNNNYIILILIILPNAGSKKMFGLLW